MKRMISLVLVMLLTGCTSLSLYERVALNLVLDQVPLPERQLNEPLTEDE